MNFYTWLKHKKDRTKAQDRLLRAMEDQIGKFLSFVKVDDLTDKNKRYVRSMLAITDYTEYIQKTFDDSFEEFLQESEEE